MENNHLESLPQTPKEPENNSWESVAVLADSFNVGESKPGAESHHTESENRTETETQSEAKENHETEDRPETLADRISETTRLIGEIESAERPMFGVENLMIDFGLDELSKRYGLEKTLEVVGQETKKMEQKMWSPEPGRKKVKNDLVFAAEAINNIYGRLEPDPDKRKAFYEEAIKVNENDEKGNDKMRMASTIYVDKHGNMGTFRSTSERRGGQKAVDLAAYEGLRALEDLTEQINDPDSLIFGENVEQARAEGKSPIGKLVEGLENPGIEDVLGRVEKLRHESAEIADARFETQQVEIEAETNKIEEDITNEVREQVKPFEEARSELAAKIVEMDDEAGRAILEEASQKMYALILEKTSEASQKIHQEATAYYSSLGIDSPANYNSARAKAKEFANRNYGLYGSRRAYE